MRAAADEERTLALLDALGRRVLTPHTIYLVGGASAVLIGWRASTRDVDLRPEPDSDELLRAISELKNALDINIELASPLDFLPELDGWRERSAYVGRHGALTVRHMDFRLQALAKLERGFDTDLGDVHAMLDRGLTNAAELRAALTAFSAGLHRFPAVDIDVLRARTEAVLRNRGA